MSWPARSEGEWKRPRSCASKVLSCATFEILLNRWPNGGAMIASRSILSATVTYLFVLAIKNTIDPSWTFDLGALRSQVVATIPWFGAIVGGFYAALYTRFAAQWEYVASVYHQIKQAECAGCQNKGALSEWKAAFIEDCEDLHLSRKASFAATIVHWGEQGPVRKAFVTGTPGGEARLRRILDAASRACGVPTDQAPDEHST